MNIPLVKLEAFDQKETEKVVAIFQVNLSDGSYELFEKNILGYSKQNITISAIIFSEVLKKCLNIG